MKYVRLLDTTAIKECDDGALVINTETGENFYVNKTGLLFLRALDGTVQKADSVISMLLSQFDKISEDDFSHDFFEFFSEIKGKGIVAMSENIADVERANTTSNKSKPAKNKIPERMIKHRYERIIKSCILFALKNSFSKSFFKS